MIRIHNAALAVIASACLASPVLSQDREPVTMHVRYDDLKLASASGQATLKARIHLAAEAACPPMEGTLDQKVDSMRCRQEMAKDGAVQVARLTTPSDQKLALAEPR